MDSQQDQNAPPAAAAAADDKAFKLTAFSDEAHDSTFHFQILHLTDQVGTSLSVCLCLFVCLSVCLS
jgi:predicted secreted protein